MAALSAIRHNPDYVRKYRQLRERGNAPKVALTAIVRKIARLAEMPSLREVSSVQIVQSITRERNRMMARTKRSRRRYGAGEWSRNRVWIFPDPVIRHGFRAKPDDLRMITVEGDSKDRCSQASTAS